MMAVRIREPLQIKNAHHSKWCAPELFLCLFSVNISCSICSFLPVFHSFSAWYRFARNVLNRHSCAHTSAQPTKQNKTKKQKKDFSHTVRLHKICRSRNLKQKRNASFFRWSIELNDCDCAHSYVRASLAGWGLAITSYSSSVVRSFHRARHSLPHSPKIFRVPKMGFYPCGAAPPIDTERMRANATGTKWSDEFINCLSKYPIRRTAGRFTPLH